jgi:hypothetical protein
MVTLAVLVPVGWLVRLVFRVPTEMRGRAAVLAQLQVTWVVLLFLLGAHRETHLLPTGGAVLALVGLWLSLGLGLAAQVAGGRRLESRHITGMIIFVVFTLGALT